MGSQQKDSAAIAGFADLRVILNQHRLRTPPIAALKHVAFDVIQDSH